MPNYECSRCHKVFKRKSGYDDHMKRKFPCKEKITAQIDETSELKCPFCEKEFKTKYNLLRHINNNVCHDKKQIVKIVEENNQLKAEIKNLLEENNQLKTGGSNIEEKSNTDKIKMSFSRHPPTFN
jgi:uncharacterized C2H2 Zn-finger protein